MSERGKERGRERRRRRKLEPFPDFTNAPCTFVQWVVYLAVSVPM